MEESGKAVVLSVARGVFFLLGLNGHRDDSKRGGERVDERV